MRNVSYKIEIQHEKGVTTEINYSKNQNGKAKEMRVGEYVIRTNRQDSAEVEISKIHRTQTAIEDSFKSMKSESGIRPNCHKNDDTCTAHIFITVIAYHIIAAILKKLRAAGISHGWKTIREILATQARVTTSFKMEDNRTIHTITTASPTLKQRKIHSAPGFIQKPLKNVKVEVPLKTCEHKVYIKCGAENFRCVTLR